MSDRPASSFALGYLAAGSAAELAGEVASVIARRGNPATTLSTADLNAILADNESLRAQNLALKADVAAFKAYAKELEVWGDSVLAQLKARSGE